MPGDQPPVCPHRVNGQGHPDQTTADAGPNGYIELVNGPQTTPAAPATSVLNNSPPSSQWLPLEGNTR